MFKKLVFVCLTIILVGCGSSSGDQDHFADGIFEFVDYEFRHGAGSLENCDTRDCEKSAAEYNDYVEKNTVTNGTPDVFVSNWKCSMPDIWISTEHHVGSDFEVDCNYSTQYKVGDAEMPISIKGKITLLIPESKAVNFELPKMYRGDLLTFSGKVRERIISNGEYSITVEVEDYSFENKNN